MANDPYKYFRVEARELLEHLGKGILELEGESCGTELVPRLLRLAHTLKGAARVVKQKEIADLAHEVEERLAPFRQGAAAMPRERLGDVLKLLDAAGARVGALTPPAESVGAPAAHSAVEEPFRTLRTDVAEMDGLLGGIAEAQAGLASLRRSLGSIERAGRSASPAAELRGLVAEGARGLSRGLDRVEGELSQVRAAGERLRLLPAGTLFNPLERAVRDAAQALGKRAAFKGDGGEIRLDGHVLGALQAALVQVVRNAVAHGLEAPSDRVAAGKPAEGTVAIEVARRGDRIAFVCRDDGRGVDLDAVRRALQRKGLLSPEAHGSDPEALLRVLLEGGITTSSRVTEVSGRGIGLDVVRSVISGLGGRTTVRTRRGEGTTLELVVPVSLSSLEALLVGASEATAAIPLRAVRQTVRVPRKDSDAARSIVFEGRLIPFLPLARALGAPASPGPGLQAWSAVVVAAETGVAAVGVDRLLGSANILVRPLPALAPASLVVGGASLDAEGNPLLVLDPEGLVVAVRAAPHHDPPAVAGIAPVLIVDDSLTTRMLEQSILESAGFAVDTASSGEEALEKAHRQRHSLFLVDVEMPGMDGFALLEHLQSDAALRATPAILVTSRSSPEDRSRGARLGARAYIVKSDFDQVDLLGRIRSLVG